jgi:ABC-type phosphate transport system substrate-binding protein
MTDTTRNIIDYAQDENAIGFKDALYASIHDKVTAHIEAQKQQVAQRLIEPQQDSVEAEDPPVENS